MVESSTRSLNSPSARQFDLLNVFEWMLLVGLFFAALAGGRSEFEVSYRFTQMPADDSDLETWYVEEAGLKHVDITRVDGGLVVHVQQSTLWTFADLPDVPFDLLGYTGLSTAGFHQSTSFLGMPTLSLVVGVLLLLAIRMIRWKAGGQSVR